MSARMYLSDELWSLSSCSLQVTCIHHFIIFNALHTAYVIPGMSSFPVWPGGSLFFSNSCRCRSLVSNTQLKILLGAAIWWYI